MRVDPFASYRLDNLGGGHYHLKPTNPESCGGDVRISFLPGGYIAIYGDLCPGRERHDNRGVISAVGYGLGWFSSKLSAGYCGEKFQLVQVFRKDLAEAYCREQAEEYEEQAAEWSDLADEAESLDVADLEAVGRWHSDLYDLAGDSEALSSCYGYDVDNLGLLMDIQRAFARLVGAARG